MTALWSEAELTRAFNVTPSAPPGAISGVSIDSRTLERGDLFFAIKGDAHDGHDHVARAFEAGAAAAVVKRERARRSPLSARVRGRGHFARDGAAGTPRARVRRLESSQ